MLKIYEDITLILFFYFLYFIFTYNEYKDHILYTHIFFNNIKYIYFCFRNILFKCLTL